MTDPERIYLQPPCCIDPYEGRQWCEDNVWNDCATPPTGYIRADLHDARVAELLKHNNELLEQVRTLKR